MEITTDAIDYNGYFDPRYTCDFDNSSPELRWGDIPEGTAGFAVIAEDPDAPVEGPGSAFTHWVVYNIPAAIHHLPAGVPPQESLPNGIRQGLNAHGKLGYGGPCPPHSHGAHRYIFRVYALRSLPDIPTRPSRERLLEAIAPHVIATAEVMGRYQRLSQRAG
jgi:Raf kinase inhibitor-like YbhB/YbcL family protein